MSNRENEMKSRMRRKLVILILIFLFAASYISKSKTIADFRITAYFFPHHRDFLDPYIEKTEKILSFYTQKFGAPDAENTVVS